jgi:pre-mRNA-processing factor 39
LCSALQQAPLDKLTPIFDGFLAEYPLCYGYWKKYADHTMRLSPPEVVSGSPPKSSTVAYP